MVCLQGTLLYVVVDFIRTLCKFFAHGACLKGEYCEFSHDWKDPPNNVIRFS